MVCRKLAFRVKPTPRLSGDVRLSEASARLENVLDGVSAELIRDSDAVRSNVKSEVDDILSKFF